MTIERETTEAEQELVDFLETLDPESVKTLMMFCANYLGTGMIVEALDAALSQEQKNLCSGLWAAQSRRGEDRG